MKIENLPVCGADRTPSRSSRQWHIYYRAGRCAALKQTLNSLLHDIYSPTCKCHYTCTALTQAIMQCNYTELFFIVAAN